VSEFHSSTSACSRSALVTCTLNSPIALRTESGVNQAILITRSRCEPIDDTPPRYVEVRNRVERRGTQPFRERVVSGELVHRCCELLDVADDPPVVVVADEFSSP